MPLARLPMDDAGPLWVRWARTLVRPIRGWRSLWLEVYRGDSWGNALVFACLTLLPTLPLLWLGIQWGLLQVRARLGPYSAMALADAIQVVPGTLAIYLLGPLLVGVLHGAIAHALLWVVEPEARGQFRATWRVFTYAMAWLVPPFALVTSGLLYLQLNRVPVVEMSMGLSLSPLVIGVALGGMALNLAGIVFVAWGLRVVHKSSLWKTLGVALVGGVVGHMVLQFLGVGANRLAVHWIVENRRSAREAEARPDSRFHRLERMVEQVLSEVTPVLASAGLPAPPRPLAILTAGDWSAALDVKQAREGFLPSAQRIYLCTQAALKGQLVQCSTSLGERPPREAFGEPAPMCPPGQEAVDARLCATRTSAQTEALRRVQGLYLEALRSIQAEVGPFEAMGYAREARVPPARPDFEVDPRALREQRDAMVRSAMSRLGCEELQMRATQGQTAAINEMGRRLMLGEGGVPRNPREGVQWLEKAYRMGHRDRVACLLLAQAYRQGEGVFSDRSLAEQWNGRAEGMR